MEKGSFSTKLFKAVSVLKELILGIKMAIHQLFSPPQVAPNSSLKAGCQSIDPEV
jgi:hypothetical protein